MELVIASTNTYKIFELREVLKNLLPALHVLSLFDFPNYKGPSPIDGSLEENAIHKATFAAKQLNKLCLADDSGIIIPALTKTGGSHLRRYQNDRNTALQQIRTLLEEMRHLQEIQRQAYLECSLALALPEGLVHHVTQRSEGYISNEEKGTLTFEFDTIFIKHDYSKTLGELAPSVKERISHRRRALERLFPIIRKSTNA